MPAVELMHMSRVFSGAVLFALMGIAAPVQLPAQADLRAAGARLEQGRAAERSGDLEGYYTHARAAAAVVPSHPVLLYHSARAAARTGRNDESLEILARLAPIGAPRDPAVDSAFQSLWATPVFVKHVEAIRQFTSPLTSSDTAFVIDAPNLVVENLAFDSARNVFYVGSMARRTILRVSPSGRAEPLISPTATLGQPLGMKVDPKGGVLWATTIWPVDSPAGRVRTTSELLAVSIASGRILRRLRPPDTTRAHLLNDIVFAANGSAYISDSEGGAIWVLPPTGDSLREFTRLPATVLYPNGIALSPDGRALLVAHQSGIVAIDLASRAAVPLRVPDASTFMGIDGLYTAANAILGVINTSTVEQLVYGVITRDRDGTLGVVCASALDRRHPAYQMPTTGTLSVNSFYYVANSQLRRLDPKGNLRDPGTETRTIILKATLPQEKAPGDCR